MREFSSWNGSMKVKFAYLVTIRCLHFQITTLLKLCPSSDDIIAGIFLGTHFPELVSGKYPSVDGYQ